METSPWGAEQHGAVPPLPGAALSFGWAVGGGSSRPHGEQWGSPALPLCDPEMRPQEEQR